MTMGLLAPGAACGLGRPFTNSGCGLGRPFVNFGCGLARPFTNQHSSFYELIPAVARMNTRFRRP